MVLKEILPSLKEKWKTRNHRPLPESVQFTLTRFEKIWIADGSTLEALLKKLKSLENVPKGQLAGKIGVVVDLMTRLPVEIWFKENPKTNDIKFEEDLLKIVESSTLLLLDRDFYHFVVANNKGEATDPVKYFATPENKDLGIVKQKRKNNAKLIIAPFPEKQRNTSEFFFSTKFLTYA